MDETNQRLKPVFRDLTNVLEQYGFADVAKVSFTFRPVGDQSTDLEELIPGGRASYANVLRDLNEQLRSKYGAVEWEISAFDLGNILLLAGDAGEPNTEIFDGIGLGTGINTSVDKILTEFKGLKNCDKICSGQGGELHCC